MVVRGSYRYQNADENPEGSSRYQWYLNGMPIEAPEGVAIDLKIKNATDRTIIFGVTPVSATGEVGEEVSSAAKEVTSGFQGSVQKKMRTVFETVGNFSFYGAEPQDRVFVSTGGAFGLIDPDTQDIYFEGQTGWGLLVPPDIVNFLKNNPAARMFT
jgi:hypothetical protein